MIRAVIAIAVSVVLAGCIIGADYSGTEYQCPDNVCPSGFDCVTGRCVATSDDAGSGGDAGGGTDAGSGADGGIPATNCGGPGTFIDDFSTSDLAWADTYSQNGANVNVNAGALVFDLPSDPVGDADAELFASRRFDLWGRRLSLEVVEMVNPAETSSLELIFNAAWSSYLEFIEDEGTLYLNEWVDDARVSGTELAWDAVAYRWWQLREDQGTLTWETSPDGENWTVRHSIATPSYVDRAQLYIAAHSHPGVINPGRARLDNLNVQSASEPWCPIATFSDDFNDDDIGLYWYGWEDECQLFQQSGQIRLVPAPNAFGSCGIELSTAHDLTSSSVHVEVPVMVNTSSDATAYFIINDRDGRGATFVQQSGILSMTHCTPGCTSVADIDYDAAAHRWWRLREAGGTLYYETSPDGNDWTVRSSVSHSFDPSDVMLIMGTSNQDGHPSPGELRLDNLNE